MSIRAWARRVTHLRGQKTNKDEIRIRLGLGALIGLIRPKGGAQGAAPEEPTLGAPQGLYKQRGDAQNPNPSLLVVHPPGRRILCYPTSCAPNPRSLLRI